MLVEFKNRYFVASVTTWRTPTGRQYSLHLPPADPVMGQGNLHVKQDVGGLAGNFIGVVVFAGHHELSAFFADLLENAVVATV